MSLAKLKEGAVLNPEDGYHRVLQNGHEAWLPAHAKFRQGPGIGITGGTGTLCKIGISRHGDLIRTMILIDVTGLNSSAAADIIGDDGASACYLCQIDTKRTGTLFMGSMKCLETPATGEPDIDLYSATEATGTEDSAITGLTETALLNAAADWTSALGSKGLTALPADGEYLYLVGSGAGTDATYTAGKFLIELWGYDA